MSDRYKKPPTAAEMKRLAIRNRVIAETGGNCQRCTARGDFVVPIKDAFLFLCSTCKLAHAAAKGTRTKEQKKKQLGMFGDG